MLARNNESFTRSTLALSSSRILTGETFFPVHHQDRSRITQRQRSPASSQLNKYSLTSRPRHFYKLPPLTFGRTEVVTPYLRRSDSPLAVSPCLLVTGCRGLENARYTIWNLPLFAASEPRVNCAALLFQC